MILRLVHRALAAYCARCLRFIWPWQPRHAFEHRDCRSRRGRPSVALRLVYRALEVFCARCRLAIWPRQPRCGSYHRTCKHAADLATWRRNLDATGGPATCWACLWCGEVPS